MPQVICLVPVIGTGTSVADPRRAKYFDPGILPDPAGYAGTDFGMEPWMMIQSTVTPSSLTFLSSQPDVWIAPPMTAMLTNIELASLTAICDVIGLPTAWITFGLTGAQAIRRLVAIARFHARFTAVAAKRFGTANRFFQSGVTLSSTWNTLPVSLRELIMATCESFGISLAAITPVTTLRTICDQVLAGLDLQSQGLGSQTL